MAAPSSHPLKGSPHCPGARLLALDLPHSLSILSSLHLVSQKLASFPYWAHYTSLTSCWQVGWLETAMIMMT